MSHAQTTGRDLGRVRAQPAARPMDAAVFQIVPGAMAGEVRRDGSESRVEDRARQEATFRRLIKPIARARVFQASARTKQRRLVRLKHNRQAEEVAGMIALRAMVLGAQWTR